MLLCLSAQAQADVFRWQDETGRVHYGDRAAPGAQRIAGTALVGPVFHIVRNVHDGDTVILGDGTKIRLLGINTPELDSATSSAESGGEAAKLWLKTRIEGHKIRLESDAEAKDHYGRTLAHLFAEDGEHLNLALVRQGLAVVSIFPPNLKYTDKFAEAQRQARQEQHGIWGDPAYAATPIVNLPQQHARGWHRWSGRPTALDYSKNYIRLIFSDRVDVIIHKENLNLFPPLDNLVGKNLEIRGWASRRKDHYSILIRHPSALEAAD